MFEDVPMNSQEEIKTPVKITAENYEEVKKQIEDLVREKYNVPILDAENIDAVLNSGPYLSHSLVADNKWLLSILREGSLLSSKTAGHSSMTYEIDKLMDMDKNVFLGLGKSYMNKSRFALLFDPQKVSELKGATLVENDLMEKGGELVTNFLDAHKSEMMEAIEEKKDQLNEIFRSRVVQAFQGGHGIYSEYFENPNKDQVEDFLNTLQVSSFEAVSEEKEGLSEAEEVLSQFAILRDAILSGDIMPIDLRKELEKELKEKVIDSNTATGKEKIASETEKIWNSGTDFYKSFLPQGRAVPEKVTEIRVPDRLNLKDALIGVFVPKVEDLKP